uniref:G-protein coupled receptors family 1 profile domain-containing protein n=2 Tax=Lutzomyia longipalpis TaxID=7200 RepID=A0A1B0CDV9_LUTLO
MTSFPPCQMSPQTIASLMVSTMTPIREIPRKLRTHRMRIDQKTYIVPVIFFIIFIVGILGNGTLVIIFIRHRNMRNVPNTYILSLALADLLVILTTVPLTATVYVFDSWLWGLELCTVSEFVKDVSIGVSVFTLVALSGDRFFAIVDPLRKFNTHIKYVEYQLSPPRSEDIPDILRDFKYILSLALADLLVILTTVPLTATVYVFDSWLWGLELCTVSEFVKDVSIGVSVFTLVALSGDRFFAIVDPLRKFNTHSGKATKLTISIAISIWVLAIICGIPAIVGSHIR